MKKNKIKQLRELFSQFNIDGYIIPKNDAYFSEFSSPDRLKFISNFSGSAGQALILKKKNYLIIDGRYTIQAEFESGKDFKICEVPKFSFYQVFKKNKKKLLIGYDPQLFTSSYLKKNLNSFFKLIPIEKNLVDLISKKPKLNTVNPFYNLKKKFVGESVYSKIKRLSKELKKSKIDNIFISAPENVAWLLNLRGMDNPNSPIPNSKLFLTRNKKIYFFSCPKKIYKMKKVKEYKNIKYCEYKNFLKIVKNLNGKNFCIDQNTCSISNEKIIKSFFDIKQFTDPCYELKSIKNKIEIENMINSHIRDGVALTKFIYWLKKINKNKITEFQAQKKLEQFRKQDKNYLFPSFNTIAGSGKNGAIVHYRATKNNTKVIKKNEIFLCDSGGQYKYGTTDVTRTLCFSEQKSKIKEIFTKVLKGHIAVATVDLNKKKNGSLIDVEARKFLKKSGLNYNHGTGHGVGYFLNVHEGPQSISKYNFIKLKKGMILSNEPGFYKKNNFGIRIENLVYVKNKGKKLFFQNLTLAPIEKDLVNYDLLSRGEKNYLFKYHLEVYSKISKFLNINERKWLASLI